MSEHIRLALIDIDKVALPGAFATETMVELTMSRLAPFLAAHADEAQIAEILEDAGRLLGGFELAPEQAAPVLLRWMKQKRKTAPLKAIQGLILAEAQTQGLALPSLYPDVAPALEHWREAGLRLFGSSSFSRQAQRLLLGDATAKIFEGFFDLGDGAKNEAGCYRALCEKLGVAAGATLVVSGDEEELDAAAEAGLATALIARDFAGSGKHPTQASLAELRFSMADAPEATARLVEMAADEAAHMFLLETRDGTRREIAGKSGVSLLKLIRRAGIKELEAQCGGAGSCATCHIYVTLPDGVAAPEETANERRMLATAPNRQLNSRLACQLTFDAAHAGLLAQIAPVAPIEL